jgi:hypothetical protein
VLRAGKLLVPRHHQSPLASLTLHGSSRGSGSWDAESGRSNSSSSSSSCVVSQCGETGHAGDAGDNAAARGLRDLLLVAMPLHITIRL